MITRKTTKKQTVLDPSEKAENTPVPISTTAPAEKSERLTIPFKDGSIDWDHVRPSRRAELRGMLRKSGIDLAPAATTSVKTDPLVNAALANTIYDLLAQVESLAAVRMFGCTSDHAFAILQFSEQEKGALAEPTGRILNKYLPAAMLEKYADEMMLFLLLSTMTRTKFGKLRESLTERVPTTTGAVVSTGEP